MRQRIFDAAHDLAHKLGHSLSDFEGERFSDLLEEAERSGIAVVLWRRWSPEELDTVINLGGYWYEY